MEEVNLDVGMRMVIFLVGIACIFGLVKIGL